MEVLNTVVRGLCFRLYVVMLSPRAIMNPIIVTIRAVNFRYAGIVICGSCGNNIVSKNPAKMLPIRRHLMELISKGLFLLRGEWGSLVDLTV